LRWPTLGDGPTCGESQNWLSWAQRSNNLTLIKRDELTQVEGRGDRPIQVEGKDGLAQIEGGDGLIC